MIDKRRNIFRDSKLVETVIMPVEIYKGSPFEKEQWAQKILGEYVSKFHGKRASSNVIGFLTRERRATGIQATFYEGGKQIFYMVMEPKEQPGPDGKYRVHILKAEYQPEKEASPTETMIHEFTKKPFSCTLFEAAKFKR